VVADPVDRAAVEDVLGAGEYLLEIGSEGGLLAAFERAVELVEHAVRCAQVVEQKPSLLGASAHLLAIGSEPPAMSGGAP
jgi:hypothetical protein